MFNLLKVPFSCRYGGGTRNLGRICSRQALGPEMQDPRRSVAQCVVFPCPPCSQCERARWTRPARNCTGHYAPPALGGRRKRAGHRTAAATSAAGNMKFAERERESCPKKHSTCPGSPSSSSRAALPRPARCGSGAGLRLSPSCTTLFNLTVSVKLN